MRLKFLVVATITFLSLSMAAHADTYRYSGYYETSVEYYDGVPIGLFFSFTSPTLITSPTTLTDGSGGYSSYDYPDGFPYYDGSSPLPFSPGFVFNDIQIDPLTSECNGSSCVSIDLEYQNIKSSQSMVFSTDLTSVGRYQGGDACFGYDGTTCYSLTITDITPAVSTAVTPEPSTFALLGTGLLGFTGLVRKRLA